MRDWRRRPLHEREGARADRRTLTTLVALTLVAVGGLLIAEGLGSRLGVRLAKPLASTGFVATAAAADAAATPYGRVVLAALVLSWLGDVLLIPRDERAFRAGILAFLLGHVAFVCAFVVRGVAIGGSALSLLFLVPASGSVFGWLRPHLATPMRPLVLAYVAVITLMVAAATGTVARAPSSAILAAALAFYGSDLSVARDRFVKRSFANRAWGLPLYYGAQLLFAVGAGP